jgi:hypothetical protein
MRKLAIVALLAIVGAMIPLASVSAQPDTTGQDGGSIMAINAFTPEQPIDLWIRVDGVFTKFALSTPDKQQIDLPTGDHAFQLCLAGSTAVPALGSCTGSAPLGTGGNIHIERNDIINFLIVATAGNPSFVAQAENDTDKTDHDHANVTLVNALFALPVTLCVGTAGNASDTLVVSGPAGPPQLVVGEVNSKNNDTQTLQIHIGSTTCAPGAVNRTQELGFPEGSNTVINITPDTHCTSACGYQIFPGAGIGDTSANVAAFCATLTSAQQITPWLQDLFAEVQVGNPDTYPSPDKVEKVLGKIKEILDGGNEAAPSDIRGAWLTATGGFVKIGQLAAVGYDLNAIPQDSLRQLVDQIDTPAADDEEQVKAKADLGAWFVANCGGAAAAVEAEPSFTG